MLSDDDFVRGFETGTLADFPHADHVRLTIIYLTRHSREEALRRLATGLLAFATTKGVPEKFHVTITRAWVDLVDSARRTYPGATDAAALVAACPLLLERDALLRFYSRERLDSPEARAGWLPPDRTRDIGVVQRASGPAGGEARVV